MRGSAIGSGVQPGLLLPESVDRGVGLMESALTTQMQGIQAGIDRSLNVIQKKMTNIEQKVFATQKNMDSI